MTRNFDLRQRSPSVVKVVRLPTRASDEYCGYQTSRDGFAGRLQNKMILKNRGQPSSWVVDEGRKNASMFFEL